MAVEANTWLLIAKRHVKTVVLEVLFYASWVGLRLILYPYLIPIYWKSYLEDSAEFGTYLNVVLLAPLLQTYLTGLNFWWTIQACPPRQCIPLVPSESRLADADAAGGAEEGSCQGARQAVVRLCAYLELGKLIAMWMMTK